MACVLQSKQTYRSGFRFSCLRSSRFRFPGYSLSLRTRCQFLFWKVFVGVLLNALMNEAKYRRHKDERCNGSDEQASDDCTAERCILLTTVPKAQRHWDHSDDHREGGHEDWTKTRTAGLDRRGDRVAMVAQSLLREGDHENAVGCGHPHAHDRSHQGGDAERCSRDEQEHHNTRKRRRQRHHDDEWIQPRLEVDNDQHVDEKNREDKTADETDVRTLHGPKLPPQCDKASSRQVLLVAVDYPVHFAPDSAEIPSLDGAIDIDHPSNV